MLELIVDDPYTNFLEALNSDEAKRQGPTRLKYFFDSLYTKQDPNDPDKDTFVPLSNMDIKDQIRDFVTHKDNKKQIEKLLKHFVRVQKRRVKAGKIAGGTVWNYYKCAKLFCSENDIEINWKKISREMPYNREYAQDRIPNEEEIKKLIEYPDKRIKGIVFTMLSSGMRIGSWDFLQWKNISPITDENNNLVAAKIKIIDTKNDNKEYFSFITPEAYNELDKWREYRKKHGEDVNEESYVMRNLFEATIRNGVNVGKIQNPIKLKHTGIKSLLERAAESQKLFKPLGKDKRRRDWKLAHSMRKYFKTKCELAGLRSIHIEMLMGHDIGLDASYHKPNEKELLEDYLKVIPDLTIEEDNKKVDKITAQIRNEMKSELRSLRREFLIYKYQQETNSFHNFILENYERHGINISPATADMPQKVIQSHLEFERKHENDPHISLDEMAFISTNQILDRLRNSLIDEDLQILNEYIKEEFTSDGIHDTICLPHVLAGTLGVTPNDVRDRWKKKNLAS